MTDGGGANPGLPRQVAAWVSLAAAAGAVVYLGVEAVRRWYVLVLSVASLGAFVVAAWFVLSRRGGARWLAAALAVAALVVFAAVVITSESVRVLIVGLGLAAVALSSARFALTTASATPTTDPPAPRAKHPVLLMNLRSGGGKAERFGLVGACRERGIEPIVLTPGADLLELAQDAVMRGADVIGMAGGDGSQALVASVASRHALPFVVVPAGTRNHFALDLGIDRDDVLGALTAFEDGVDRTIDLAEVNGRVFVNNASMGVYAKVVQASEYRDAKLQTTAAMLPQLLGPGAIPMDLRFSLPTGEERTTANLILVSNNPYQVSHLRGAGTRPRIDGGELGIVSVLVRGAADAEKLAALEAAGRLAQFSGFDEWTAQEFEVASREAVEVGVDGEAMTLEPPLIFTIRAGALTVRLPRAAAAGTKGQVRVTSGATLAALWTTALGRPAEPS